MPKTIIDAWQCIGCGKIEAPQPCIGICQDRRVQLVDAAELAAAAQREKQLLAKLHALAAPLRLLVMTTPHEGVCLRSWQALQQQARSLLADAEIARLLDTPEM